MIRFEVMVDNDNFQQREKTRSIPHLKVQPTNPQQTPKTRIETAQLTTQTHEATIARSDTWAHFC